MSAGVSIPPAKIALPAGKLSGFFLMKNLRQSVNCIFSAGMPAHLRGNLWT
jgi:hypothetical protein